MDKVVNAFKIFLAVLFSIVFITTAVLTMTAFNLERSLFNPDVYNRVFEEEQIFDHLPTILAEVLMEAARSEESVIEPLKELPKEEWDAILRQIFPPDLLKSITEDSIVETMGYLNGESENITLSLREFKEYLLSPAGVDAIYKFLSAQPDCSLEQLTSMVTGEGGFFFCKPPEQFLGFNLQPIYEAQIRAAVRLIPDEISLIKPGQSTNKAIVEFSRLRTLLRLTPILPVLALAIITLLMVRSFKDWFSWWGFPLILTGILGVFVSLGSGLLFDLYFWNAMAPRMMNYLPVSVVTAGQGVIRAVIGEALKPMLGQSLVLGGAGGIIVLIAQIIKAINSKEE